MSIDLWKLSQPSSGLLREPQLFQLGYKSWCLWWLAEKTEGGGDNQALIFDGVEALRRTEFLAYQPGLIQTTYDSLVDLGKTLFLSDVCAVVSARGIRDLRHFAISFDTSALFEFVAQGFRFQSPFDTKPIEQNLSQRIAAIAHPLKG
jgi:hypothetical protein